MDENMEVPEKMPLTFSEKFLFSNKETDEFISDNLKEINSRFCEIMDRIVLHRKEGEHTAFNTFYYEHAMGKILEAKLSVENLLTSKY
jgi:hypothetical protein